MIKWIRNNSGSDKTWLGQLLVDDEYYQIQEVEKTAWANDSTLLTAIANADAIVSKNNATADEIADVNQAINYLKGRVSLDADGTPLMRPMPLANANNLGFKGTGYSGTATKTAVTDIDYKLPEDRLINGVGIILKNHVFGDNAKFQVVDVDNILALGAGTVLNEFGTDWHFAEDTQDQKIITVPYPSNVLKDLYIRLKYNSIGTVNDVSVLINLIMHKKDA